MTISPGGRPADASPVGKPGGRQNWVDKTGGLPTYMRMIAHALMRKGMSESHAIATAHEQLERLAATSENPRVKAAAAAALAEWETKRAAAHATGGKISMSSHIDFRELVDLSTAVHEPVDETLEGEQIDLAPGDYHPPYDWKHGFIPLTPAAAASKAKQEPWAGKGGRRPRAGKAARAAKAAAKTGESSKRSRKVAGERRQSAEARLQKAKDDHARGRAVPGELQAAQNAVNASSGRKFDVAANDRRIAEQGSARKAGHAQASAGGFAKAGAVEHSDTAPAKVNGTPVSELVGRKARFVGDDGKVHEGTIGGLMPDNQQQVRINLPGGKHARGTAGDYYIAPKGVSGPSNAEKIANAEKMFGTGSAQAKRARERWGTPDKPAAGGTRKVAATDVREGQVITETSPITGKVKRLRVDKVHPAKSDGTVNVDATNLETGGPSALSLQEGRQVTVEHGTAGGDNVRSLDAKRGGPSPKGEGATSAPVSADALRAKAEQLGYNDVPGHRSNGAKFDSLDSINAFLDAKDKGHAHYVGQAVNARQPGIERVTPGRVVGHDANGMVKIQPHAKDRHGNVQPVGTFNPSHVAPAGQEPKHTPDSRDGNHAADFEHRQRRDQAARGTLEPTAADITWAADEWKRRNPGQKIAGHEAEVNALARHRAQDKTDRGMPRTSEAEQAAERARIQAAAGEVQRTAQRLSAEKNAPAPATHNGPTIEHTADGTLVHGTSRDDRETIDALKGQGFKWSRNLNAWYLPRTWGESTRDQRVKALEAKLGDKIKVERSTGGPRRTAAEREAETRARAAARADRMSSKAEKLSAESEARAKAAHDATAGIPFGQPILVGHHSQRRHERALEKAHANDQKSWDAAKGAKAAQEAADRAQRTAAGNESKVTIANRLERNRAELRDIERRLNGTSGKQFGAATGEHRTRLEGMQADLQDRIQHDEGKLAAAGGVPHSKDTIKPGDFVKVRGQWYPVTRANAKSLSIPSPMADAHSKWTNTTPYHEVQEHKPASEVTREDVARMIQGNSTAFPGLNTRLALAAPPKDATPAAPEARAISPETARRMSDDQLEKAYARLLEGGATDTAAMHAIEKELDRRDQQRAGGSPKAEAAPAAPAEDPQLDTLTFQADRKGHAFTPEVIARMSPAQIERSLSTLLSAGHGNESELVQRLTAALEQRQGKRAAQTFRKGADNLERDQARARRAAHGDREQQKQDYRKWVEQQAAQMEASDMVGAHGLGQRSRSGARTDRTGKTMNTTALYTMTPAQIRANASPEALQWFAQPGRAPLPFDAWRAAHLGHTDRRAVESLRRRREQWLSEFG